MGRVEANCLRCMYHGILYDESGKVVEIPGQKHISKNMHMRANPDHIHDFPPLSNKAN